MFLGNFQCSERPTNLDDSKARAYCASVSRDGVVCIFLFFFFYLFIYLFFTFFVSPAISLFFSPHDWGRPNTD